MNNMKRLLSVLLCLAMVLAVLPMAVFAADTITLYCAAPSSWTNCNIYAWNDAGSNGTWPGVAMTLGSDGLWYAEVDASYTKVIFNNGSAQTSDMDMPTDDKVQYNYDAGEWVTYGSEVEVVETVYYLRGSMNSWVADATNAMTNNGDGTYTYTAALAAGSYEFKAAVADWSWSCPSGSNMTLTLDADDTVTFTLDINANTLNYTLASGTVVEVSYYLMGSMNEWTANDASKMTKQDDGTYAITLSLAAGTYEYKAGLADWSWSCPGDANASVTLAADADVTFVLDVANNTLTNNAPAVEEPAPEYDYYVAGAAGLCGVEWDPASNLMTKGEDGLYTITFTNIAAGTYEYKITTGSWDTPSYGYGDGNYQVTTEAYLSNVTITFNAETTEVNASVEVVTAVEPGAADIKWQITSGTTAESATTDLRLISWVDSLDYESVVFTVTANGVTQDLECTKVYTSINAAGVAAAPGEIFENGAYFVTYVLEGVSADEFDSEIVVSMTWTDLEGNVTTSDARTIVISSDWA